MIVKSKKNFHPSVHKPSVIKLVQSQQNSLPITPQKLPACPTGYEVFCACLHDVIPLEVVGCLCVLYQSSCFPYKKVVPLPRKMVCDKCKA